MRQILNSQVRNWTQMQNIFVPSSFSEYCPHCSEKVTFAVSNLWYDADRGCVSASSNCPGCTKKIGIWSLIAGSQEAAEVFINPKTGAPQQPKNIRDTVSEALYRSYISTIDAYNSGNYVATAVCCRRTLEGLFQGLLPEGGRNHNLARAISKVAESVDLAEPIRNLANVLRQGGNLGAHFDMEKEPDSRMALQMLKLLENLIDFLHVLPKEIRSLEQLLDSEA